MAGAAYLLQSNNTDPIVWQKLATVAGEQQLIVPPDSTVVYLSGKPTLYYPPQFQDKQRVVRLSGEAFFEVSRNPQHPFFVVGKDVTTNVLGTAFNVDTDLTPGIAVAEGKVQVVSVPQDRVQQVVGILVDNARLAAACAGRGCLANRDCTRVSHCHSRPICIGRYRFGCISNRPERYT